ncbi:MAG: HAD family phosphatase [Clostridia bacterium]|nr:HAD family phosphatase [Clostridia bacterium]
MRIKGAIFDMDGTLIDSLMYWDDLWQRIGAAFMNDPNFRPGEEVDKRVRTMIYDDAMLYFRDFYNIPVDVSRFLEFTKGGIPDFYRHVACPKAGAIALLEHLKGLGIPMCLASATDMSEIRLALEYHHMAGYFDAVLSCADIGVGKDRPDIYLMAKDALGLEPSEICVFEDSFVALETAKAVGFQTVGIYDRYNFEQARLQAASDLYVGEHGTLDELIASIAVG